MGTMRPSPSGARIRLKGTPMFAIHPHRLTQPRHHTGWEIADHAAAALAVAAVVFAAAWLGMTI